MVRNTHAQRAEVANPRRRLRKGAREGAAIGLMSLKRTDGMSAAPRDGAQAVLQGAGSGSFSRLEAAPGVAEITGAEGASCCGARQRKMRSFAAVVARCYGWQALVYAHDQRGEPSRYAVCRRRH